MPGPRCRKICGGRARRSARSLHGWRKLAGSFWGPPDDPQFYEKSALFHACNLSKRGITLDLNHPDGLAIAKRLVARSDVERLRRSGQHLLGLINDILNFTKLDAGQVEFRMETRPLAPLVDGLPCGMMIVGRHFDDANVLRVAHTYEQACGGFPAPPGM